MSGNTDYFGNEVDVGDIVSFPVSGYMEDAEVIAKSKNMYHIKVKNKNDHIKLKHVGNVINKSKAIESFKISYPENYV